MKFFLCLYILFFCLATLSAYLEKKKEKYDLSSFLENSTFLHAGIIVFLLAAISLFFGQMAFSFYLLFGGCLLCFYFLTVDGMEYLLQMKRKK